MTHCFDPSILREYDIRGEVGRTLGPADATALGRAFATRVRAAGGRRIAVGYDGRLSSPLLEAALIEGLTASGVDVVRVGLAATPMLYYAEAVLEVDGAIQVTGSHNPPADNGFKLVHAHAALFGDDIRALGAIAVRGEWADGAGGIAEADVLDLYVARLTEGYAGGAFRIGWDAGNGAAGPALERLTATLPGEHRLLYTDVDGHFPNHHPDPTDEANLADLRRLVADEALDMGIALDGDGDRIVAIDARGRVLWGDRLLAILAEPVLRAHPGAAVVADVKSSGALFDRIRALGGAAVMAPTGHSLVKAKMRETGAPIGGEMTGHIMIADRYYGYDDALYAAVRLIGAVRAAGGSLADLVDAMPPVVATPEIRIAVAPARRAQVVTEVAERLGGREAVRIDGLRVATPDGWWLLRASNTQDMLTVRAEAGDPAGLARTLADLAALLGPSGVTLPM